MLGPFALYIVDRICMRSVRSGTRVAAAADADAVVTPEATAAVATVEAASGDRAVVVSNVQRQGQQHQLERRG